MNDICRTYTDKEKAVSGITAINCGNKTDAAARPDVYDDWVDLDIQFEPIRVEDEEMA